MGFIWIEDKEDDEKFKTHLATKIDETTESISRANGGLKKDISTLKKKVKEKEDIDIDSYNDALTKVNLLKNEKNDKETDLEKRLRLMQEQMDTLKKSSETLEQRNTDLLIDDTLRKGLVSIKIKPELMKAAERIIKADVSIVDEDNKKTPKVGDKTISEHLKDWAETPEGKNFVLAKSSSGGGSGGSNHEESPGEHDKFFDKKSKDFNLTKQIQLKLSNIELYEKLKTKHK